MEELDKVFFNPGDIVKVRHKLENTPLMYVIEKVTRIYKKDEVPTSQFIGIKCRWFDNNNCIQESIFSSKDLIHVK